ncbi:uncharacterized protein LOC114544759 [Dendronephthya gigantea]|uniref:uncharacterized protein LOC114544759 n=1 Tax=Dendronephthya gigantea TaxID=151771 RepID=UPI001069E346|nr:uncharacterized protein LOC114544759 [Dendronephthya gigantea]
MASSDSCLIHFDGKKGPLTTFSDVSFQKFLDCRSIWLTLDGEHRDVARRSLDLVSENVKNVKTDGIEYANFSYHRACYSALTNNVHIKRAQVRCQDEKKERKAVELSSSVGEIDETEPEEVQPAKKMLRSNLGSASTSSAVRSRNPHVLPHICIICKREKSYFTESKSKKRKLDKLVSAETVDGGKLKEAATRKNDESVLIQIANKDMVALEVKYHKRCYEKYTSFLRHTRQSNEKETEKHECKYEKSFDVFCMEFVNARIIRQDNIFYMKKLTKEFIKTVRRVEKEDASSYRSFRLKKRLRKRFPQLVFHRPKVRSKSEIVYAECLSQASVAESFMGNNEETSQSSQESDSFEIDGEGYANMHDKRATLKELYTVGMTLKSELQDQASTWYENWPPLASDITAENVRKVVTPCLFNFMTWLLGFSDDPEDTDYIELEEKTTAKVFSLCQDLVYVANKGKVQTPKSLALAIAVRQISGCSGLINILNGFGHCVSLSSTMAYDSAIAQTTINTSNILPREFVATEYVNLVYDNIDFGEEIEKQTHVTNGIITQRVSVQTPLNSSEHPSTAIKKTQRTVKMPSTDIVPYSIGVKMTPEFQTVELDPECLELLFKEDPAINAYKLDLAYILVKYICSSDEEVLPGWTGFNTMLCSNEIPDVSRVGYLPVIDASPTEYSTINTILTRSTEIADKLELRYAVLVFDEAVYAKVQHARWKEETFLNRFVVRLGEFHTIMCYLSAMSKIFEDGGLKDAFIESGIVSEGSIKGILSGKHYNRAVSCHKIMYEALQRLRFQAFLDSMTEKDQDDISSFIESMANSFPHDKFLTDGIENPKMLQILQSYELFINDMCSKSRTFSFWSMYIKMAGVLLMFIRATREVNWDLHLAAFRAMLPWFFIL